MSPSGLPASLCPSLQVAPGRAGTSSEPSLIASEATSPSLSPHPVHPTHLEPPGAGAPSGSGPGPCMAKQAGGRMASHTDVLPAGPEGPHPGISRPPGHREGRGLTSGVQLALPSQGWMERGSPSNRAIVDPHSWPMSPDLALLPTHRAAVQWGRAG